MQAIGVQRKRTKGYRLPPNTKSVCRPGKWGNPHKAGPDCSAEMAVARYERDLVSLVLKDRNDVPLLNQIGELRGYNLACFCPLDQPCHRNVLLKCANDPSVEFCVLICQIDSEYMFSALKILRVEGWEHAIAFCHSKLQPSVMQAQRDFEGVNSRK